MAGFEELAQMLIEDMSINLRGRDIGMAEQHVQHPQIRAMLEQMAGKGVTQHVRGDLVRGKPRIPGELL